MSEVQYVTSELLTKTGIKHGWFMRYGGVSEGLFESLNGKKGTGDPDGNVDENRRRAVKALGKKDSNLAHIVHSFEDNILEAATAGEFMSYDAAVTQNPNIVLSQTTADCASIIIASVSGAVAGLIHGSWHTLGTQIISDVITKMRLIDSTELIAGIGPMICENCYEYGAEAADIFDPRYLKKLGDTYLVNLKQMAIDQLLEAGITQIDDVDICALEDERFFSHRRSGPESGRFITLTTVTDVI